MAKRSTGQGGEKNWVQKAVDAVGGATKATAATGVRTATFYEAMGRGSINKSAVCLGLAKAAAPKLRMDPFDLARKLAGLED